MTSWHHCLKDTSILPGMGLPLKVFIQGVPSHNPMASVFIRCPHIFIGLSRCWGARRLSPRFPPSIWLCRGRRSKWLFWGFPPSPSQTGGLPVIHIRIPVSHRISPRCWWWVSGGAFSSLRATSMQRSSMELLQLNHLQDP